MISHHHIGTGAASPRLAAASGDPEGLLARVADLVVETGLGVVARHAVPFEGGGLTLVWVLAESHLVVHYWPEEAAATIDLHVCDFQRPNAARARALVALLDRFCFAPGTSSWRELEIQGVAPAPVGRVS